MPVFGGVAKVRIGGHVYLFDKVYTSLYLGVPLPVDAVVCTEFMGMWRCGSTVIPAGTRDIIGERWWGGPIPVLDSDLAYALTAVPSSEIYVIGRNPSFDPVGNDVAIARGYLYMFIYDRLNPDQDFLVYCKDEDGYQTADTYVRGPTVFFAYYDKIDGYENGGYGKCAFVRASPNSYYSQNQTPILVRISNASYITPIRIALFAYGRGILPGTKKDWLTAIVDITSVAL
jgi:hypothetical protein